MTAALSTASAEPPGGRPVFDQEFRAAPRHLAVVRADVRACLRKEPRIPAHIVDDALCILGELVANACVHAEGSSVRVALALLDDVCVLTGVVHDDGPGRIVLPGLGGTADAAAVPESGFGLRLVVALANTCGVRRTRNGKEVYFAVRW